MAENKNTVLSVIVGGASVEIDTVQKARKALKELNSEALKGSESAKKAYAELKDKLEDVQEATNTLKGSGIERLTSSFSLMSQGFLSFDTEKISTGFKGIGAAMGAIPIFLLIQGITLLIENFDKVIEFVSDFTTNTNELEAAANSAATAINSEADALKNLTDISEANLKTELLRLQSLKASMAARPASLSRRSRGCHSGFPQRQRPPRTITWS